MPLRNLSFREHDGHGGLKRWVVTRRVSTARVAIIQWDTTFGGYQAYPYADQSFCLDDLKELHGFITQRMADSMATYGTHRTDADRTRSLREV